MNFLDNNLVRLALVLGAALLLLNLVSENQAPVENLEEEEMEELPAEAEEEELEATAADLDEMKKTDSEPAPAPEIRGDDLSAEDLLPKSAEADDFAQRHPEGLGPLADKNFLTAGFHVGVNTVGTSLRNANTGIRSEPANPTSALSPWNNTTITPDINRRALEIGCE